jgi:hypothetical protein
MLSVYVTRQLTSISDLHADPKPLKTNYTQQLETIIFNVTLIIYIIYCLSCISFFYTCTAVDHHVSQMRGFLALAQAGSFGAPVKRAVLLWV